MTYDPWTGNLLTMVSDAGGAPHFNARTSYTYNGRGQVLTATDPMGVVTLAGYDNSGNPTSVTRDAGPGRLNQLTTRTYSPQGDVLSVTDPNGNVTASTYDNARRLTTVTSPAAPSAPNGVVTALSYDADGRVVQTRQSVNGAVLRTTSTTYTLSGKPATATDANGNVTAYAYDTVERLVSVTDAVGRVTSYAYDAAGRRTKVFNTAIQAGPLLQQGYSSNGALASLADANGNTTGFAYDGFDRLATTTYPGGSTETFTYDAGGNVLTRKTRANGSIAFTYDTLNRLSTKTPPSPQPAVSYAYDLAGRLTGVSDTSAAIVPALPPSGTRVQYATSIAYDGLNRPTGVTFEPAPAATAPTTGANVTFTHTYNKANQRTGQTVSDNTWWAYPTGPPSTVSYTANALNQYTAVGAVTPTYDGNGNLTFDGTFTFGYDAENRLVSASGAGNTASYAYDAQGRRKSKTVNGTTTVFVTDADNREVMEYDGASGQVQRWYAYGLGPNDVLGQMNVPDNTRLTFLPDQLGSIVGVLNGAGALTRIGYAPYGKNAATTSFAYTGQRRDAETNGLHYYRARMYSTALGRFSQADPIGYSGGLNLYAYTGNDPLNFVDRSGLATQSPQTDNGFANLLPSFANGLTQVGEVTSPAFAPGLAELSSLPRSGGLSRGDTADLMLAGMSDSDRNNPRPGRVPGEGGGGGGSSGRSPTAEPPSAGSSNLTQLGRQYNINANSPAGQQVLQNLDTPVTSYISQFRAASVRREFPAEHLNGTVRDALKSGDPTARKLLIDSRFAK